MKPTLPFYIEKTGKLRKVFGISDKDLVKAFEHFDDVYSEIMKLAEAYIADKEAPDEKKWAATHAKFRSAAVAAKKAYLSWKKLYDKQDSGYDSGKLAYPSKGDAATFHELQHQTLEALSHLDTQAQIFIKKFGKGQIEQLIERREETGRMLTKRYGQLRDQYRDYAGAHETHVARLTALEKLLKSFGGAATADFKAKVQAAQVTDLTQDTLKRLKDTDEDILLLIDDPVSKSEQFKPTVDGLKAVKKDFEKLIADTKALGPRYKKAEAESNQILAAKWVSAKPSK